MNRRTAIPLLVVVAITTLSATPALAQAARAPTYLVNEYNPARDPGRDLQLAVRVAHAQNKNVLLVVGGDWCVWCEILDRFLRVNDAAREAMTTSFVMVKLNTSRENQNEEFLSQYPTPEGYPDFVIIGPDGNYLGSQDTSELEEGRSYNARRMIAFAERWRRT